MLLFTIFILIFSFTTISSIQNLFHTNRIVKGVSKLLPVIITMQPITELSISNAYSTSTVSNSFLLSDSNTLNPNVISSIANIERVYKSIRYVEEDIANKGEPKEIISQIKFLLKNYNLKESILTSLDVVNKSAFDKAKLHGLTAVENLSQIFEYFSDEVDNMSGNKFPPKEVLTFAQEALKSSKQELKLLLESYPSSLLQDIEAKVAVEFGEEKITN